MNIYYLTDPKNFDRNTDTGPRFLLASSLSKVYKSVNKKLSYR